MLNKTHSIKSRLALQLTLILILGLIIPGSISLNQSRSVLKEQILHNLSLLAENRSQLINHHLDDLKDKVQLLGTASVVQQALLSYSEKQQPGIDHKTLAELQKTFTANGLYNLLLVSPGDDIIYSARDETRALRGNKAGSLPSMLTQAIQDSKKTSKPVLTNFSFFNHAKSGSALIVNAIYINDRYIGAIATQTAPDEFNRYTRVHDALGETGEILFAIIEDGFARHLVPFRHQMQKKEQGVKLANKRNLPIQQTLKHDKAVGLFTDYRGQEVFAYGHRFENINLGMVIKIDTEEALKPVSELSNVLIGMSLLTIIITVILFYSITTAINTPIKRLITATRKINIGDNPATIDTCPGNIIEFQQLAESFNNMLLKLEHHSSENRLVNEEIESIIHNASQGIITINNEHAIVRFNPEAEKLFGYEAEEILGQKLEVLLPEHIRPGHGNLVNRFEKGPVNSYHAKERAETNILQAVRKDGSLLPVEIGISRHMVDDKWFFTAFITDNSERRQYELDLIKAKKEAEQANYAKSMFLANMSHELRTPMHGILSFANIGSKKAEKENAEKYLKYFDMIEKSGSRLLTLLNDLLDLAKLESGKMRIDFANYSLREIADLVAKEQALRLQQQEMKIEWITCPEDTHAEFDKDRLTQVLSNLFSNAIKFNKPGSAIELSIEPVTLHDQPYLQFSIRDHGEGILEHELELIFDKFAQSSRNEAGTGGTGLGLPICREITSAHHGAIWAENHPDGGAIFRFTLPLKQPE